MVWVGGDRPNRDHRSPDNQELDVEKYVVKNGTVSNNVAATGMTSKLDSMTSESTTYSTKSTNTEGSVTTSQI